jgi:hypothetical protein
MMSNNMIFLNIITQTMIQARCSWSTKSRDVNEQRKHITQRTVPHGVNYNLFARSILGWGDINYNGVAFTFSCTT